jgi:uncharacterized protein YyaL (SSP411 family)
VSERTPAFTNRLAAETSPYLLQHQHNPVDWYAWGPEAFAAARAADKPIFLSVGYSTCYWCHVMERQSFESADVARVMNRSFINVKVDREERPDVDQLYMTAVQVITRQGGWPMSVWLTPDLRPFHAGTYFPPRDMHGRPGFVTVLDAIADAWTNRRDEIARHADELQRVLEQLATPSGLTRPVRLDDTLIDAWVEASVSDFDPKHGGFGGAPKFPRQTLLEMLLRYVEGRTTAEPAHERDKQRVAEKLTVTLDAMARGGIRDQLGGGFHRYSTDAEWLVPHFEIMLYDQAMLAGVYADAYRVLGQARFAAVARGICDFVLREMTDASGTFFTAFDAEVDAREGLNYLWTKQQVHEALPADEAALFCRHYGLDAGPNFADPHHGSGAPDANVLFLAEVPSAEDERTLERIRGRLYELRQQRKKPMLDTKVLTSWNALMIGALARVGVSLGESRYIEAATRAANVLLVQHRTPDGGLVRTSRDGRARHDGLLEDYAYLADACLVLHEASGRTEWREHAAMLAIDMIRRFGADGHAGFYFSAAGADDLIVRQRTATDSPLPAPTAVAATVMQRLDEPAWTLGTLRTFMQQLLTYSEGMSAMVQAAILYHRQFGATDFAASGGSGDGDAGRPGRQPVVSASAVWTGDTAAILTLTIADGYHVGSRDATDSVATEVRVLEPADRLVESIAFPDPLVRTYDYADAPLSVYEGTVAIVIRFARRPDTAVKIRVAFQPCSETACLEPGATIVTLNP